MVWGIDAGTRCTGIATGDGSARPAVGVWHFDHCGENLAQLMDDFDRKICALAERCPPTHVIYEAPVLAPVNTLWFMRKVHGMGAHLELWGLRNGVIVREESPQALKKRLTGNYKAKKPEMVAMAKRLGLRLPPGEAAKDAADAAAAWLIGVQHYAKEHLPAWDQALYGHQGRIL